MKRRDNIYLPTWLSNKMFWILSKNILNNVVIVALIGRNIKKQWSTYIVKSGDIFIKFYLMKYNFCKTKEKKKKKKWNEIGIDQSVERERWLQNLVMCPVSNIVQMQIHSGTFNMETKRSTMVDRNLVTIIDFSKLG